MKRYNLIGEHKYCLETKFFIAGCKEILKVGAKEFHDDNIASILGSEPLHSGESNILAHNFHDFALIDEL